MIKTLIAAALLSLSLSSHATVITFSDWQYSSGDHIDWQISIDDESHSGYFTFNISIGTANLTGDILGFAFDSSADFNLNTDLVNFSAYEFSSFGSDSLRCGSGCNFNGAVSNGFDYIFKVGQQGSSSDYVSQFSFGLEKGAFTLDENLFTRVGIRAQSVGSNCTNSNCNGSVKDFSENPGTVTPEPTPVPEPGTAILLGSVLLGFAARKTMNH
ncbi:PEP-CTERM sorting domain-containing protein [Thalassomonas haliotis]|uniref:PEP-CTERM sorting domain-containing protein n=1 Tax=Thalassomonas haliotis TaxID=485448 RepID=A0ABY7VJK8_9GAMM|nr:PEP-CTERM sorting domain-containing protein [Thalassomonas haliotis]WDE13771.1 PEP-CTERM sorting domain-containing protein [Thalassomonas haliotis]